MHFHSHQSRNCPIYSWLSPLSLSPPFSEAPFTKHTINYSFRPTSCSFIIHFNWVTNRYSWMSPFAWTVHLTFLWIELTVICPLFCRCFYRILRECGWISPTSPLNLSFFVQKLQFKEGIYCRDLSYLHTRQSVGNATIFSYHHFCSNSI